MEECSDKRLERMLYAYELGMLSDEDRREVEMHLMECESCFRRVQEFRETARLIQADPDVRNTIEQLDRENPDVEEEVPSEISIPAERSKRWSSWARTALAAAAVLVIIVLQPWKVEISPKQEAVAAENLLAIMPFGNLPYPDDPQKLGEIITNLLMTNLSQSEYFQVISSQRLYDLLKLYSDTRNKIIDPTSALEIARKARAQWMLTGDILQTEPTLVVTAQLIEVSSGNILGSQQITADSGMTIFALTDSLSGIIRNDLPLQAKKAEALAFRPVANISTNSQEAFRYYMEGRDYYYRLYLAEAVKSFEKALEYDSTFAMVYYYLAALKDPKLIGKAVEYSSKATEKEKLYIQGLQAQYAGDPAPLMKIYQKIIDLYPQEKQAYYILASLNYNLKEYDKAINLLNSVIALDPLYGNAYRMLSFSYGRLGNLNRALEMNDRFVFLEPNEPNPYDARGDIFTEFKMYDRAIESYKKALEKKPDFYRSWRNLGIAYTYSGDFIRAESCFKVIAAVKDIYVWTDGKVYLAQNLIYRGKYKEALAVMVEGSAEDKSAHGQEIYSTYHHLPALIYEKLGDMNSAVQEIDKGQGIAKRAYPQQKIYWRRYYVRILAEAGNFTSADSIAQELKISLIEAGDKMGDYWYSIGTIEMARGNLDSARINFERATNETDEFDYTAHYMLGRTLLELNQPDAAISQFKSLLDDQVSHPENWADWEADTYYYLGLAYQKSGAGQEAIQNLTKYLDIMKEADPQIKFVTDARERLNSLSSASSS